MKNIRHSRLPLSVPAPNRSHRGTPGLSQMRLWHSICLTLAIAAIVFLPRHACSEVLFEDGFESGFSAQWTVDHYTDQPSISEWGTNSSRHNGGNWSAFSADNGDDQRATYDSTMLTWMQLQNLSLEGYSAASLEFRLWMNTEPDYDLFYVFVRDQFQQWHELLSQSGRDDTWRLVTLDLDQFIDQSDLWISFEFFSDSTVVPASPAGVWIDDVVLNGTPVTMDADMELANLAVGPSTIAEGEKFDYCTYEITNHGPISLIDEQIAIDFYVSANRTLGDGDDARIGTVETRSVFVAGVTTYWALSASGLTGMVRDWPAAQPEGDYYILAVLSIANASITDPEPANNHSVTSATIFFDVPLEVNYAGASVDTARASVGKTLVVSHTSASRGVSGTCHVRQGGVSNFSSYAMVPDGNESLHYALRSADFTPRGIEYYFDIASVDESVRIPGQSGFFVMRTELSDVTVATTADRQYKMIGFPFEPNPASVGQVFDEIPDLSANGWRFGRWDPVAEAYAAYPALTTVNRGYGYWLVTSGSRTIRASGVSSIPDDVFGEYRYGEITLVPGWNQISNPFAFNVGATAVELGGSVEGTLYAYTSDGSGSGYQVATTLQPYTGYWIYNGGSRSYIRVPYTEGGMLATEDSQPPGAGDWQLRFLMRSGPQKDLLNVVGTNPDAAEGYDRFDCHEPPGFAEYVSMSFLQTNPSGAVDCLSRDFRPSGRSGYTFDVLLKGNTGEPMQFTTAMTSDLPSGYRVLLIDPQTSDAYDLLDKPTITLPDCPTESGTRYKLIVGTETYLAESRGQSGILPRKFALLQNYPNPFNSGTVISYDLPEISDVEVKVYDVLGRHVITLVQDNQESGQHQVRWDGRDVAGKSLASGVYFYCLEIGDNVLTRKMVLLK